VIAVARPTVPVQVRTYRGHRLELRDDGGTGWTVAVHPPGGDGGPTDMLRNSVPNGLTALLAEAKHRVDRRLDGAPDDAPLGP
jgi:hypothetical protein